MALGIPEAQRFPHVSELQDLGTDVTKLMSPAQLCRKIAAFMCKNYGPIVTLWNDPRKIDYFSGDEMSKFDGLCTEKQ